MKATIELPDELYRQVKSKTALQGRRIRDVTVELYENWLAEGASLGTEARPELIPETWLEEWLRLGDEAFAKVRSGPSTREILQEDRNERISGAERWNPGSAAVHVRLRPRAFE